MRQFHTGTVEMKNLKKHAEAPKYPETVIHPNEKYHFEFTPCASGKTCRNEHKIIAGNLFHKARLKRLRIYNLCPELQRVKRKIVSDPRFDKDHENWLDHIDLAAQYIPNHKDTKIKFEKILEKDVKAVDVMCLPNQENVILAAAMRQMKRAPTPDPKVADDFLEYAKKIIEEEVGEELNGFKYSYQQWYSHLPYGKQLDMDLVSSYLKGNPNLTRRQIKEIESLVYEGIAKVELQPPDGKPRMVCAIPKMTKFVMGPITWQLEEIFGKKFKGYCGGKNLDELDDEINLYLNMGFTKVVEGDGSAFDNTQDVSLKEVDRYIYGRIKDKVYHVERERFLKIANQKVKTMNVVYHDSNGKKRTLMSYDILGTVFSGDCDTTLMNTVRMALYNRYVNDKAGLKYGVDYVCFSKGDDFSVLYKPYISDDFINRAYYKYFLKANKDPSCPDMRIYGLGQVLKMLDIGDASTFKFCSLRSWFTSPDENRIFLTRDPTKFLNLAKYSRKATKYKNEQLIAFYLGLADALHATYPRIKFFTKMAEVYERHAAHYADQVGIKIDREKINKIIEKMSKGKERNASSNYEMEENEIETLLYDVGRREHYYALEKDYWSTIKILEQAHMTVLTESEAAYVNAAIENEIDSNSLLLLLGIYTAGDSENYRRVKEYAQAYEKSKIAQYTRNLQEKKQKNAKYFNDPEQIELGGSAPNTQQKLQISRCTPSQLKTSLVGSQATAQLPFPSSTNLGTSAQNSVQALPSRKSFTQKSTERTGSIRLRNTENRDNFVLGEHD